MTQISIEIIIFPLELDGERQALLYRFLSNDEKDRAAAFRFDKHRRRFVTGRGTIREILAHKCGCPPQAIRFGLNDHGKPSLHEPESRKNLQFNASSSDAIGSIALANHIPLGLDIEKIDPASRRDYDLIVENEFSNDERDWYRRHEGVDRIRVFFELWACKEAYLKALGLGLSAKLNSFTIDFRGQQPRVSRTEHESGGKTRHSLHQLKIADGFTACLALPRRKCRVRISHW